MFEYLNVYQARLTGLDKHNSLTLSTTKWGTDLGTLVVPFDLNISSMTHTPFTNITLIIGLQFKTFFTFSIKLNVACNFMKDLLS